MDDALAALKPLWKPRRTILFYPVRPTSGYMVFKECVLSGYAITDNPHRKHDLAFLNEDVTVTDSAVLDILGNEVHVVNRCCTDISKRKVQVVFEEVFGYPLRVDPTAHNGLLVEKSDENAAHDGRILRGPISYPRPECVYERVIDNTIGDGQIVDYRVPVYGQNIPLVYLRERPIQKRFVGISGAVVRVREADDIFSGSEQERIVQFAERMGMSYGQLDVLRDKGNGRIYIVDANRTPYGEFRGVPTEQAASIIQALAANFTQLCEDAVRSNPAGGMRKQRHENRSPAHASRLDAIT